jgi:multiple sugar transport system substrate-binding protein
MRQRIRILALLTMLMLAAAACNGGGDDGEGGDGGEGDGEPTELVWAIGGAEANPGGAHHRTVELWNEANPDTPVRLETLPESADEQRQQMALELDAGGDGFDILGVDVIWTGEFAENGWLESLEDVREDFEGEILDGPFESAQWDGELWVAPYNSNAGFLYYRKDLVPTPPTTWDEAKQMAAEHGDLDGFAGQGAKYEGFVVNFLEYFWGAGGEILSDDGEVQFGEGEAASQALDFMRTSMTDGFFAPGFNTMKEEEARNHFQAGNAVFMRNWPYAYDLLSDEAESQVADKFDIAPLPTFSGDGTISALGGFNNGVSAFSKNKEAAKAFVVFAATNAEVQAALAERAVPPVLASTYDELQDNPVMALLGEVLADARPRPPAPAWNEISVAMQNALFPAYNGEGEAAAAIESVTQEIERLLAE